MASSTMTQGSPGRVALNETLRFTAHLVKDLWERARLDIEGADEVSLVGALLLADVAVETILKHLLGQPRGQNLDQLLDRLETTFEGAVSNGACRAVRRLRGVRNQVQHDGVVHHAPGVARVLDDGVAFLRELYLNVIGLPFDDVSFLTLVQDPTLAATLRKSTELLADGRLTRSLVVLAAAYEQVRLRQSYFFVTLRGAEQYRGILSHALSPVAMHVFSGEYGLGDLSIVGSETQLADRSNKIASLVNTGFRLADQVRLYQMKEAAEDLVRQLEEGEERACPLHEVEIGALMETVARQVWRLEQLEPEIYGPGAIWFQPQPEDTADHTSEG